MAKINKDLHERLVAALSAAQKVYHNPEWVPWAKDWQAGKNRISGPALEAAAIPGAEAEERIGGDYAACLAAFYATTAIASATVDPNKPEVALSACARALKEAKGGGGDSPVRAKSKGMKGSQALGDAPIE